MNFCLACTSKDEKKFFKNNKINEYDTKNQWTLSKTMIDSMCCLTFSSVLIFSSATPYLTSAQPPMPAQAFIIHPQIGQILEKENIKSKNELIKFEENCIHK